jgi:HEAT repeat protein
MRLRARVAVSSRFCSRAAPRASTLFALALFGALAMPHGALAEAKRAAPKKAQGGGLSLEELSVMLASQDSDELRMAIESAASLGKAGVAPLLIERVRAGLPHDLLKASVEALVAVGDARAGELLAELTHHRRAEIRASALTALSIMHPPGAENELIKGLSDHEASVRKAAAEGLGQIGTKMALPALFKALEHDVDGSAAAIGRLAEASTVPRVTAYFGRTSFLNLAPILDAIFMRRTIAENVRVDLAETIIKHGTTEARAYMEGLAPRLPADTPPRLRKTVSETLLRMPK